VKVNVGIPVVDSARAGSMRFSLYCLSLVSVGQTLEIAHTLGTDVTFLVGTRQREFSGRRFEKIDKKLITSGLFHLFVSYQHRVPPRWDNGEQRADFAQALQTAFALREARVPDQHWSTWIDMVKLVATQLFSCAAVTKKSEQLRPLRLMDRLARRISLQSADFQVVRDRTLWISKQLRSWSRTRLAIRLENGIEEAQRSSGGRQGEGVDRVQEVLEEYVIDDEYQEFFSGMNKAQVFSYLKPLGHFVFVLLRGCILHTHRLTMNGGKRGPSFIGPCQLLAPLWCGLEAQGGQWRTSRYSRRAS
jgi:hypothetical protein